MAVRYACRLRDIHAFSLNNIYNYYHVPIDINTMRYDSFIESSQQSGGNEWHSYLYKDFFNYICAL